MINSEKLLLPVTRSFLNLLFSKISCIHEISMTSELADVIDSINNEKFELAQELIKKLKTGITNENIIKNVAILTKQILDNNSFKHLENFQNFLNTMYKINKIAIKSTYVVLDEEIAKKLIELAKKTENITAVTFHLIKTLLNFFKAQEDWESPISKKLREDLEYVDLIQMYLNGSKELPERKTDNFNYALLSEFLKKDDLRVLKSLENYLDSAENKALGAAGSVAQSIEKEDLEPGVKKKKKDIKRIEKLED